ncbi:MAG TPA: aquaporin [Chloroflexia bacterium]|nr:aquaporin [Chloroflexia bacterium]
MEKIDTSDWYKVIAEVLGTFFFFLIGIGSALFAGGTGVLYVALAHGIALALAISFLGHISGGHFNPAVTLGMVATRRMSVTLGVLYIIGQILGGILSCLVLLITVPNGSALLSPSATPNPAEGVNFLQAVILEAVLTFFLVMAVFGTAVDRRGPKVGGFAIGLTVFAGILIAGPLTGGAMNPARDISPYIVFGPYNANILIYIIGPIIGGVLAALLYSAIFLPKDEVK